MSSLLPVLVIQDQFSPHLAGEEATTLVTLDPATCHLGATEHGLHLPGQLHLLAGPVRRHPLQLRGQGGRVLLASQAAAEVGGADAGLDVPGLHGHGAAGGRGQDGLLDGAQQHRGGEALPDDGTGAGALPPGVVEASLTHRTQLLLTGVLGGNGAVNCYNPPLFMWEFSTVILFLEFASLLTCLLKRGQSGASVEKRLPHT